MALSNDSVPVHRVGLGPWRPPSPEGMHPAVHPTGPSQI